MKKTLLTILTVALIAPNVWAAEDSDAARGVNPADNLTKLEFLPHQFCVTVAAVVPTTALAI